MKRWALGFGLVVIATIIAADLDLLGCLRPIHEIPLADKLVHFALYGLLNFFTILAIGESRPSWGGVSILTGSSLVIAAAAALEEFSQRYIAARTFSAWAGKIGQSHGPDVTGGMKSKVAEMLALVQAVPGLTVRIFSGEEPGNIRMALAGESLGTLIASD